MNRLDEIRERLSDLAPVSIDIRDDSALHAGHEGAKGGGGHYHVRIVSERFKGMNTLARHRLVYGSVGDMMKREIHALAIEAKTPAEAGTSLDTKDNS